MITLEEAKEQSLKRWRKILSDYPDITVTSRGGSHPCTFTYGNCGFCEFFTTTNPIDITLSCKDCPLYSKVCANHRPTGEGKAPLYWRIVLKLRDSNDRGLKQMLQKMVREIERVDTSASV